MSGARWLARRGLVVVGTTTLALLIVAYGTPWWLVVDAPIANPDVLYVFPGGVPDRALCAAALYRDGVAPHVVVTGARIRPELRAVGQPLSDADVNARILEDAGVSAAAISVVRQGTSTWEDAVALRDWARARPGTRRILAITSPTHSRRARRTLARVLRGTGIGIGLTPCPPRIPAQWWRDEDHLLRVINEYIKMSYYAVVH
jgi:uncharacterized SAM-binding protein YcdF (DUF218 family)